MINASLKSYPIQLLASNIQPINTYLHPSFLKLNLNYTSDQPLAPDNRPRESEIMGLH